MTPSAIAATLFAFVVLGAGLAVALVPNGNTFNACRNNTTFAVRIIDKSVVGQTCAANETAISWKTWKWRGAWTLTGAYVIGDAVATGGQSYTAVANSTNKPPATSPAFWNLLAAKGAQGIQGIQGVPGSQGLQGLPGIQGPPGVVSGLGTSTNLATLGTNAGPTCALSQMELIAGSIYPIGTVPANGQMLSISQNQALFALLLTTYGGNGISTFALPNLQSVAPDHMTYVICTSGIFP
ncbi:MAG: hypothetical protein QOI08_3243 [Actinomycetota bacterium]|nr:hypothetical protein [Actinomycetota bacterium]